MKNKIKSTTTRKNMAAAGGLRYNPKAAQEEVEGKGEEEEEGGKEGRTRGNPSP